MRMKIPSVTIAVVIALAAPDAVAEAASSEEPTATQGADDLLDTISALDAAAFDAFNRCDSVGQLEKHASYFAPDV